MDDVDCKNQRDRCKIERYQVVLPYQVPFFPFLSLMLASKMQYPSGSNSHIMNVRTEGSAEHIRVNT